MPLAAICGLGTLFAAKKLWIRAVSLTSLCITGTAVLYAIGTAWFCAVTGSTLTAAIAVCVLPFLPGDALKIASCVILILSLKRRSTYEIF
jgi:biotin transport system substrate-specific component